ncbi:MAG: 16S rRNA (cytosine(967)-C(5))-methyltransferase RsmB [Clostridia bacterium]|nr:16S rRNA (cytosine(967)-C(5))-methyltransferase RsmB [Clostridia bacterium]
MADPRQLAFRALRNVLNDASYSNLTLAGVLGSSDLSGADKSFITALVYGVLERKLTLDHNLSQYLTQPLKKLNPKAYVALLLGAYQILYMEKVPSHAAINESVRLVKQNGAAFAAGLCNAVLRKVDQNGLVLPAEDAENYDSVRFSVPQPLLDLWYDAYGKETTRAFLEASFGPRPLTVRVNTTKTTADELIERLRTEGVTAAPHPHADDALVLTDAGSLEQLDSFREGLFHVQDAASQLCCANLAPEPGDVVFDLCAAPGGKSCTLAERMGDEGIVRAFDLHENRVGLIRQNAERLGLGCIVPEARDATEFSAELGLADRVLCDVPCAGYGDLGRKPEVRYRDPALVDNLSALQYDILNNGERYLKPGGRLVYSTCSLTRTENEDVARRFLAEHPDMTLLFEKTYFPQDYECDGFYNAVFTKEQGR